MKHVVVVFALASTQAFAAGFDGRVIEAKQASQTPVGAKYDASLGPFIGSAMQACIPIGSTDPANLGSFTLVGYVSTSGKLQQVEVQPLTSVSSCFAEHFGQATLPLAPHSRSGVGYPVVVEMRVGP